MDIAPHLESGSPWRPAPHQATTHRRNTIMHGAAALH